MYQLGWFATGRDKAARDLLATVYDSIRRGEIKAEIAFVFCNREAGESPDSDLFLKQVRDYRIPLVSFSSQKFAARQKASSQQKTGGLPPWRYDYDRAIIKRLADFHPDLCVLAGYMLIVTRDLCQKYHMINLHPAAPGGPTGTWQEVIWKLIDAGATETGVMMHLVTPELDKGPPVAYCTFSIRGKPFDRYWVEYNKLPPDSPQRRSEQNPLFQLIRQHGLAREFPLIIATIKAFSEGKVRIIDGKVVDVDGKVINGYNVTSEIDKLMEGIAFK